MKFKTSLWILALFVIVMFIMHESMKSEEADRKAVVSDTVSQVETDSSPVVSKVKPQPEEKVLAEVYTDPKGYFKIIPPKGWRKQEYSNDPRGKVAFYANDGKTDLRVLAKVVNIPDYKSLIKNLKDIERRLGVKMNIEPVMFNGMPAIKREATISMRGVTQKILMVDILIDGVSHNLQYCTVPSRFDKYYETVWQSMLTYEPNVEKNGLSQEEAIKHEAAKWIRLAQIALEMGNIQTAKKAVAAGLEAAPDNEELKRMKSDLDKR